MWETSWRECALKDPEDPEELWGRTDLASSKCMDIGETSMFPLLGCDLSVGATHDPATPYAGLSEPHEEVGGISAYLWLQGLSCKELQDSWV